MHHAQLPGRSLRRFHPLCGVVSGRQAGKTRTFRLGHRATRRLQANSARIQTVLLCRTMHLMTAKCTVIQGHPTGTRIRASAPHGMMLRGERRRVEALFGNEDGPHLFGTATIPVLTLLVWTGWRELVSIRGLATRLMVFCPAWLCWLLRKPIAPTRDDRNQYSACYGSTLRDAISQSPQ